MITASLVCLDGATKICNRFLSRTLSLTSFWLTACIWRVQGLVYFSFSVYFANITKLKKLSSRFDSWRHGCHFRLTSCLAWKHFAGPPLQLRPNLSMRLRTRNWIPQCSGPSVVTRQLLSSSRTLWFYDPVRRSIYGRTELQFRTINWSTECQS